MLGGGGADHRAIVLLSPTINSPSTRAVLADFRTRFPGFRHVVHDPMSLAALREANRLAFGAAVVPHFRFDRARVVVALEADFLGTWLAPVEFARQWARRRTADGSRGFHVQCEAGLSVTGSNADLRLAVAPSEVGAVAVALLAAVARRVNPQDDGLAALNATGLAQTAPHATDIDRIADALAAPPRRNRWWSREATTSRPRSSSASSTRCWATSARGQSSISRGRRCSDRVTTRGCPR